MFMFDNEQVVGKSWNVSANNKVKMSIISNVAVVQMDKGDDNLQQKEHLVPGKWISSENKEELISTLCHGNLPQEFEKKLIIRNCIKFWRLHYSKLIQN